jgi:hypothetical protein
MSNIVVNNKEAVEMRKCLAELRKVLEEKQKPTESKKKEEQKPSEPVKKMDKDGSSWLVWILAVCILGVIPAVDYVCLGGALRGAVQQLVWDTGNDFLKGIPSASQAVRARGNDMLKTVTTLLQVVRKQAFSVLVSSTKIFAVPPVNETVPPVNETVPPVNEAVVDDENVTVSSTSLISSVMYAVPIGSLALGALFVAFSATAPVAPLALVPYAGPHAAAVTVWWPWFQAVFLPAYFQAAPAAPLAVLAAGAVQGALGE